MGADAQVLFNKFVSGFPREQVPFALDENYMVNHLEHIDDYKIVDPIFLEFIYDEKGKEKIYRECGGYLNIDSCMTISFVAKPEISPSHYSLIYSEKTYKETSQLIKYYLATFSLEGELISTIELAKMEFDGQVVRVWEGYIFAKDNIFSINKSYERPEDLLSLAKQKYKMNNKGKISDM